MWAWGDGGLWRLGSQEPQRVSAEPITAAAANGAFVAWSDGSQAWIGQDQGRPVPVTPLLDGVRALAWDGPNLWALDKTGLHRSGGGILRWRLVQGSLGPVEALAGGVEGVWALRRDGVVLGMSASDCPAPWTPSSAHSTSGLQQPRGLAGSQDGWFAVVDTMNARIRWYSDRGICLDEFGAKGAGKGMFNEPSGLDLAADGRLAVADTWNGRIQIVHPDGSVEIGAKSLFGPREVLWAPDGSLLVADTGNRRVLRLTPPSWEMTVVAELDGPVVGLAWVGDLLAAATPAAGSLSLVDPASGEVARTFDIPGWVNGEQQEGYLVLLPSGEIAASAPKPGEIWLVDPEGSVEPRLLRSDLLGVTDMTVRPDGILLVSLTWDHRLVRIDLKR